MNRRKNPKNRDHENNLLGFNTFERFYMDDLEAQAKVDPRQINEEDFQPKRASELKRTNKWESNFDKALKYFDQLEEYQEEKLQQSDRKQLFSIFEQMFEKQRRSPASEDPSDPLYQAQQHIRDYFKDPQNFDFYEKGSSAQ